MEIKTVKEKLQQVADNTELPEYAKALETAVRLIDRVEELEKELRDERDRFDRYADYSVERDRMIDQLKEEAVSVVRCKDCKHMHIVGHGFRWCKVWERIQTMGDDGYCCFGERRDDNES